MTDYARCAECGSVWNDGQTCEDRFHLMGFWELDHQLLAVHHLMVLCYHLQHPSLYSPHGLAFAEQLLIDFVEGGITPQEVRTRIAPSADSGTRKAHIKGTTQAHGRYLQPVQWTMTATDVIARGMDAYYGSVQEWATSILAALRGSGNLPASGAKR